MISVTYIFNTESSPLSIPKASFPLPITTVADKLRMLLSLTTVAALFKSSPLPLTTAVGIEVPFLPLTTVGTRLFIPLPLGPVAAEGSAVGVEFVLDTLFDILFELLCFLCLFLEEQMLQRLLKTTKSMIRLV